MSLVVKDRVKETTTTTGTGTINLAGASTGFQTFVAGVGNGNTTFYAIEDGNGSGWEIGIGTVTDASPDTLARTTILASSNSGSAITLTSSTHAVFSTYPAGKAVYLDASGNLSHTVDISADTNLAAGTGITLTGDSLSVDAAQSQITSLGTLTALAVDDVAINGKVITMTGDTDDTAVITAGTNGTLSIVTTDDAAAAANIQITADGTVDIDSAGVLTLDSGAAINLEPASGSAILLDGTISIDAGVVTGATSITSTAFVGALTGNVTGNASGSAATVTGSAQTAITTLANLVTVGTIGSGTWEGTTIAIAQGGTGATSLNNLITLGNHTTGNYVATIADAGSSRITVANSGAESAAVTLDLTDGGVTFAKLADAVTQTSSESFSDSDTALMTAAAIQDKIEAYGYLTSAGDINGVTAGTLLDGGGTSGTVTLNVDLSEAAEAAIATGDYLLFLDGGLSGTHAKENIDDIATLFAGTGLSASSAVLSVDASQTQITAVGTIATGTWQGTAIADSYISSASTWNTGFVLEDDDGTEVTITDGKEIKFVEGGGINIDWTDVSDGSDSDPYDLTFTVTGYVGDSSLVTVGALNSGSITSSFGNINNGSNTITTTGLISGGSLDIDDVVINGTYIGHTDDTDLINIANGGFTTLGTITVGVDDAGHNVKFYGNTSGRYMEWGTAGDTLIVDGSLTQQTGTLTYASLSDGSITITAFVDEDNMASDSATLVPTQQSVKAYIDSQVSGSGMTSFYLEDGDGTEVTISNAKEVKFVEGTGIDINWTDTSDGSDSDPYDLTFTVDLEGTELVSTGESGGSKFLREDGDGTCSWQTVSATVDIDSLSALGGTGVHQTQDHFMFSDNGTEKKITFSNLEDAIFANLSGDGTVAAGGAITLAAAQTNVTSLLATDIKIGEDDQTKIDFETADEIHFYAANVEQVYLGDNIFGPQSDSDVDLGSTGVRWKDAFVDSITVTGEVDGASLDISGNADIDGTLEADAYTVNGVALDEYIADTIGAMVGSNTETGIAVSYEDGDNTLDFVIGTLNQDTTGTAAIATTVTITDNESTNEENAITFTAGGDVDGGNLGLESDGDLTYNPSTGTVTATIFKGNVDAVDGDFDGTLEADAITVGGTNIVTGSLITTLGTISAGVWQGTAIASSYIADNSITGAKIALGSDASGDIMYNNGTDYVRLAKGDDDEVLTLASGIPSWATAASGGMSAFILEDDDGTEVSISNAEEVKFIGSGITTNWTDTTPGSDGDPFDMTFTVDAAQTGITSILATDLKIGEDDQTKIDFETADEIHFYAANVHEVSLVADVLQPATSDGIALGTGSLMWSDLFLASGGVINFNNGDVTLTHSSNTLTVAGGNLAATLSTAAQTNITSLGTLTALTVDDIAIDGKVITMTGSTNDTAVFTVGTHGTLSIVTTDTAAAAANIQITADGTVDIDSAGVLTLDSGAAINIEPASGSAILLDGTISIDAGVVTGATSITSTAFVGDITGDVTGNASGTAATVTGAAQTAITSLGTLTALTVDDIAMNAKVMTMTGSTDDTAVFTVGTHGTLSIVTTDTAAAAANIQITADGTVDIDSAGVLTLDSGAAINIEPASGSAILLDGTISIDAGVVTGATSITSTAFVGDITGDVTGNADTATLATSFTASANNSTNETVYPVFVDGATGTQGAETDTGLTYNPSTGQVTALKVQGTTSIQTALIEYTDGDDSMTINDGGKVTFAAGFSVGSDAAGDILYHDGTSYVRLAKGSNDEVLTLASGVPSWAAAGGGSGDITGVTLAGDSGSAADTSANVDLTIAGGNGITTSGSSTTLTVALDAALTTVTSLLATDIKIGEDDQTKIDFETADEIHFYAANVEQVYLADNIFGPQSDSDVDLGTTGVRWKDAYIDTITTTGDVDVLGNIELGHASDTTIARASAGQITVEGTAVILAGAVTGITSLLATDIKIGEDGETAIDFETANEIHFDADNAERVKIASDGLYVDKIRRHSDSSTTTKILLNDEVLKLYAGHSSNNICTIDSTGLTIDNGSLETATIDYTDGDLAMTIADGGAVTFAKSINQAANAVTDGGAVDIDCSTSNYHEVLMNANATSIVFTNATAGQRIVVRFKQHSSHIDLDSNDGWDTVTVNGSGATVTWPGGTIPTLTETNNAIDVYGFIFQSTVTNVHAFIIGQALA